MSEFLRKFIPHSEIASCKSEFNPEVHKTWYRYNYINLFKEIGLGHLDPAGVYRKLVLSDIWFILYFVMGIPDEKKPNHPFVVGRANEIMEGEKDYTLDVWSREHFKTSLITIAETIQDCLGNPEESTAIYSHKASIARGKFLFEIKRHFETSVLLKKSFPDVLWEDAQKEAPIWSLDGGLILKRKSNRGEPNVSAHGLIEGMPTSIHTERRKYDDILTEDMADSLEYMEKVKEKYDSSQNLGTENGTHRVIGTFYHHNDPLCYIRDKVDFVTKEKLYLTRIYPATHNGLPNGVPVLISEKRLNALRHTKTFFMQQLCNPTPLGTAVLNPRLLKDIEPDLIPSDIIKFMVIDPAGDNSSKLGDDWGVLVCGVAPKVTELGASKVYILDAFISKITESEAIEMLGRMYLNNGMIRQVGYERLGNTTPAWLVHMVNYLRQAGRYIELDPKFKQVIRLAHGNRNKIKRIEDALAWPLNNSCLHISSSVPLLYRDRLRHEMEQFPYGKDDGLDALTYLYDVLKDFNFSFISDTNDKEKRQADIERNVYNPFA